MSKTMEIKIKYKDVMFDSENNDILAIINESYNGITIFDGGECATIDIDVLKRILLWYTKNNKEKDVK